MTQPDALPTLLGLAAAGDIRLHRVPGRPYRMHYMATDQAKATLENIGVKFPVGSMTRHAVTTREYPVSVSRESINAVLGENIDAFVTAVREPEKKAIAR